MKVPRCLTWGPRRLSFAMRVPCPRTRPKCLFSRGKPCIPGAVARPVEIVRNPTKHGAPAPTRPRYAGAAQPLRPGAGRRQARSCARWYGGCNEGRHGPDAELTRQPPSLRPARRARVGRAPGRRLLPGHGHPARGRRDPRDARGRSDPDPGRAREVPDRVDGRRQALQPRTRRADAAAPPPALRDRRRRPRCLDAVHARGFERGLCRCGPARRTRCGLLQGARLHAQHRHPSPH